MTAIDPRHLLCLYTDLLKFKSSLVAALPKKYPDKNNPKPTRASFIGGDDDDDRFSTFI